MTTVVLEPNQQRTITEALSRRRDSDLNSVGITLQPTDRIFTDARLLGPVVYKLRTVCAPLKYSMWHLLETARLYPDPTGRITQTSSTPPVHTHSGSPGRFVLLLSHDGSTSHPTCPLMLDPYD